MDLLLQELDFDQNTNRSCEQLMAVDSSLNQKGKNQIDLE